MPGDQPFRPQAEAPPTARPYAVGTLPPGRPIKPPPPPDRDPEPEPDDGSPGDLELTGAERAAMAEEVELTGAERREVLRLLRIIETGTLFDVLGVDRDTPKRALKRAYFKVSKQFHPDRYYGKVTGSFGPWLSRIFETANAAFDTLSDDRKRAEYLARLDGRAPGAARRYQTHQEHAAELFDRACQLENQGDLIEALKLFAAVARVDPRPTYLRRAGRCALAAGQLSLAEEYAKKAAGLRPGDPSSARLLASVFRAAGRLQEAVETLEKALALPLDNDTLVGELQSDLAAVRKDLADKTQ